MKVAGKVQNTIAYKKTNSINPQINQAPCNIKPLVVKQSQFSSNASMMAMIEQQKTEQIKRQKEQKIRNFQQNIRLNASRISEQKSLNQINLKKQKQDVHQKQKQIKMQYTKIYTKKPEQTLRTINIKPQIIDEIYEQKQQIIQHMKKAPSVKVMRQRSKSPLSPLGIDKSQIAIPKYIEQNSSSSSDYVDSDNEGEDVESVMKSYMNVRKNMSNKFK